MGRYQTLMLIPLQKCWWRSSSPAVYLPAASSVASMHQKWPDTLRLFICGLWSRTDIRSVTSLSFPLLTLGSHLSYSPGPRRVIFHLELGASRAPSCWSSASFFFFERVLFVMTLTSDERLLLIHWPRRFCREANQRRIQRLIIFLWQLTVNKIKAKLKWKKSFEEVKSLAAEMLTDFYWV